MIHYKLYSLFVRFLQNCRQLSVSMGNAIKYIKWHITNTPTDMPEEQVTNINIDIQYTTDNLKCSGPENVVQILRTSNKPNKIWYKIVKNT